MTVCQHLEKKIINHQNIIVIIKIPSGGATILKLK